jgi:N-acetylglucosaminyldiphosphoundecaprenol N-acetyl-beta-D-mannosaminyltransferase
MAEREGYGVYILGARREVLDTAVQRVRQMHPRLRLLGTHDGYFTDDESPEVAAAIRDSGAQILFVAMSSPRKERWIGEYGSTLNVPFVMGVGGSIDVVAGIRRRAPRLWQRLGFEWLYRLLQEPRRLFLRYLVTNVQFGVLVARGMTTRALASTLHIPGFSSRNR